MDCYDILCPVIGKHEKHRKWSKTDIHGHDVSSLLFHSHSNLSRYYHWKQYLYYQTFNFRFAIMGVVTNYFGPARPSATKRWWGCFIPVVLLLFLGLWLVSSFLNFHIGTIFNESKISDSVHFFNISNFTKKFFRCIFKKCESILL